MSLPTDTTESALLVLQQGYQRLKDLGWKEIEFCPKDGTVFEVIEVGSTGVHKCHYQGEWPRGHWWIHDRNHLWPSRPSLYRLLRQ